MMRNGPKLTLTPVGLVKDNMERTAGVFFTVNPSDFCAVRSLEELMIRYQGKVVELSFLSCVESYRPEEDTVGAFFDECCVQGFGVGVEKASVLYDAYKLWCATRPDPILAPLTALAFGKDLKFRGMESCRMLGAKYWRGVALVIPWKIKLQKAHAEREGAPA